MQITSPSVLLDALGGYRSVAAMLGIADPRSVHNWTRPGRGIPASHWSDIIKIGAQHSPHPVAVTLEMLERLNPVARHRRPAVSDRSAKPSASLDMADSEVLKLAQAISSATGESTADVILGALRERHARLTFIRLT